MRLLLMASIRLPYTWIVLMCCSQAFQLIVFWYFECYRCMLTLLFVILTEDELYVAEVDLLWLLYWSLVEWLWLLH